MSLSSLVFVIAVGGFLYKESSVAYAVQTATDAVVVTLQVDAGITITSPPDTTLSNTIGVSNNTAVGTTTWTVATNNTLGYFLGVKASTFPAMKSATDQVQDFSTSSMPTTWSVAATDARFGFSAFGTGVLSRWGTGSFCNGAATSTFNPTLNYYGFYTNSTTTTNITSTTTQAGNPTTICYVAQQGTSFFIPSGTYTATITATATTN